MTIPDYQSLMLPLLRLVAAGETRVPDVAVRLAAQLGLEPEERDRLLASGRQTVLHNRIHWAKFYMGKAGLIDAPRRGRFAASEAGRALLAENPERIDVARLLAFPAFRAFYKSGPAVPRPRTARPPRRRPGRLCPRPRRRTRSRPPS